MKYLSVKTSVSKKAIPFAALVLLLAANRCIGQSWAGTDDFSSGISATNWMVQQMSHGQMIVVGTNGHASFIVPVLTNTDQSAYIAWRGTPTAAEDWAVDILGHNSALSPGCQLQLAVINTQTWTNDAAYAFRVAMDSGYDGSVFDTAWWFPPSGGSEKRASVGTTVTLFGLRLVYHAASQTIEAWYDPTASGQGWTQLDSMTRNQMSPGMTATNTFSFAILGNNDDGGISEGEVWADNFRLASSAPLAVTTHALPNGTNGVAYSQQLSAAFGQPSYTWSLLSNSLPSGLALATNGVISGTPTANGTFNFTVKVTDALSATATQALTLTVVGPPSVVRFNRRIIRLWSRSEAM